MGANIVTGPVLASNQSNTTRETLGGNTGTIGPVAQSDVYNIASSRGIGVYTDNTEGVRAIAAITAGGLDSLYQIGADTTAYANKAQKDLLPLLQAGQAKNSENSPLVAFGIALVSGLILYFVTKK